MPRKPSSRAYRVDLMKGEWCARTSAVQSDQLCVLEAAITSGPHLPLETIRRDPGVQARVGKLQQRTLREYIEAMAEGAVFPPIVVFNDGTDNWLADGFHRAEAAERLGLRRIAAEVRAGTCRDAVLYAVGANASHGLRRTVADKRHAVALLLKDEEWGAWSDRAIAQRCAVSAPFVAKLRRELGPFIAAVRGTQASVNGYR